MIHVVIIVIIYTWWRSLPETREIGIQTDPESVPPTSPPRGTGTQTEQSTSPPRETGTQTDLVIIRPTSPDAPLPASPSTSHADTPLDSRQDILWTPSPVPWQYAIQEGKHRRSIQYRQ